jgi:hypothetical protein
MNPGAGVTSLDALSEWYAALVEFRAEAQNSLSSLVLSLQRAADWLDQQQQYWRRQIRVLEEEASQAKAELMNRQFTDFLGEKLDCSVQEENLRIAKARLEFAEDRLEATRRWSKRLPQEMRDVYDSPTRHLGFFLDGELPRALAQLARQLTALEQYANLRADAAPAPDKEKP